MRIFVCEDDRDISELMEILIMDMGFNVKSCGEASKVVPLIKDYKPNLIIVDYWIKGMKADEVISLVKKEKELKNIPIILVSAIDNLEQVASRLDIIDYIKKPFDILEFQNKIKNNL